MRLLVLSDLHNEHRDHDLPSDLPEFDVAVLAGDISGSIELGVIWINRQRRNSSLADTPVIYVPGNHEFYHREMQACLSEGKRACDRSEHPTHLLATDAVTINGVRFVGATLWTDYQLNGSAETAKMAAGLALNDHRVIRCIDMNHGNVPFSPEHAARLHKHDRRFIEDELSKPFNGPVVVVTHHAPHPNSVKPRYRGDALSAAFASDLSDLIEAMQPTLWIHGHDHSNHDYMVGSTRVIANQAGYPTHFGTRENAGFRYDMIVEI